MSKQVLLLNYSYEALGMQPFDKAMLKVTKGKAEIIEAVDGKFVHTEKAVYPYPFVIRMLYMVKQDTKAVAFTRRRIFVRDLHTCQYCGAEEGRMTIDHVIPQSKGGGSSWTNCVTACMPCNRKKSNKMLQDSGMKLKRTPYQPAFHEFHRCHQIVLNKRQQYKYSKYVNG